MDNEPRRSIIQVVSKLVSLLSQGKYSEIASWTNNIKYPEGEIRNAIVEYGRTVAKPQESFYNEHLDIIPVRGGGRWSVVLPLWTEEEGISDLSVELTYIDNGDQPPRIELDGIHVR